MSLKRNMKGLCVNVFALSSLLAGLSSKAQEAAETAAAAAAPAATDPLAAINSGDVAWMLVSAALVLLMTPALAFFYAGMVRTKNAVATLMQSMIAICVVGFLWYAFGYSMAFAPGSSLLGGFGWSFFNGVGAAPNADYAGTIPHQLFAIYQGACLPSSLLL